MLNADGNIHKVSNDELVQDTITDENELYQAVSNNAD